MRYGKVGHVHGKSFALPPSDPLTLRLLDGGRSEPQVRIGCPVWSEPSWLGTVYPAHARPTEFLKLYARQFSCVEMNSTFYAIPDVATVRRWAAAVGPRFRFTPKFPREISHGDYGRVPTDLVQRFTEVIQELGPKLGLAFLQLPPGF